MRDGSADLAMTQATSNQFLEERRRTRRLFNRMSPLHPIVERHLLPGYRKALTLLPRAVSRRSSRSTPIPVCWRVPSGRVTRAAACASCRRSGAPPSRGQATSFVSARNTRHRCGRGHAGEPGGLRLGLGRCGTGAGGPQRGGVPRSPGRDQPRIPS